MYLSPSVCKYKWESEEHFMYWDSLTIAVISYKSDEWWLNFVGLGSNLLHFKLKGEETVI